MAARLLFGLLAAAVLAAPAARAADLDHRYYPEKGYSYQHEPYYEDRYPEQRFRERYDYRDNGSYKDDPRIPERYGYADPYRHEPYRYAEPRIGPVPPCILRGDIKAELARHGWGGFHDLEMHPHVLLVNARRPNGLLYRLKVDRCTGIILNAQIVQDVRRYSRHYNPTY